MIDNEGFTPAEAIDPPDAPIEGTTPFPAPEQTPPVSDALSPKTSAAQTAADSGDSPLTDAEANQMMNELINDDSEEDASAEQKEVPRERQQKEIYRVGATVLNQEGVKIRQKVEASVASGQKIEDISFTPAERAFMLYDSINSTGVVNLEPDESQGHHEFALRWNDRDVQIAALVGRTDTTFTCQVVFKDGQGGPQQIEIPAAEITKAFLKVEGPTMVDAIPEDSAKESTQMFVDSVVNDRQIDHSADNDILVNAAAIDRGLVSNTDFIAFFKSLEQQKPLSEEQKKVLEELQKKAKTSNLLLEDEAVGLVASMGLEEESANHLTDIIKRIATGEFAPESSKAFLEAMRSGNEETIMEAVGRLSDLSEEELANKKRELAEKMAAGGFLGLAFILKMMWEIGKVESNAMRQGLH